MPATETRRHLLPALVGVGVALAVAAVTSMVVGAPAGSADTVVLQTTLNGAREIAADGSRGAGDLDGIGYARVTVSGQRVCARLNVAGIELPALAAHIHDGDKGVNGPIVVVLATPGAQGRSQVCADVDAGLAASLVTDPGGFYVNVHTAAFPDGAVRGNLSPARGVVQSATALSGAFEVATDGSLGAGDDDGFGVASVGTRVAQRTVCFSISVVDVDLPALMAHIHEGPAGVNDPIVVTLTAPDADGRSDGCTTVTDVALLRRLAQDPEGFYVNVHTAAFPSGAVRGQLAPAGSVAVSDPS